jgi:hypothetical protein
MITQLRTFLHPYLAPIVPVNQTARVLDVFGTGVDPLLVSPVKIFPRVTTATNLLIVLGFKEYVLPFNDSMSAPSHVCN